MIPLVYILGFFVCGTAFSLISSAAGFLIGEKDNRSFFAFFYYLLYAVVSLYNVYDYTHLYKMIPGLLYFNHPLEFLLGPLVFYLFRSLIERKIEFDLSAFLLLLPFVGAFLFMVPFFLKTSSQKLASIGFYNSSVIVRVIGNVVLFGAAPYFVFCLILFVFYSYRMLGKKSIEYVKRVRFFQLFSCFWIVVALVLYVSVLLGQRSMIFLCIILINIALVSVQYLYYHQISLFVEIKKEVSKIKYQRSRLNGVNTAQVLDRLNELMSVDKVYHNEKITLSELSAMLSITVHQLSEILNKELKTNFKSYINTFRIEEAKKRLIENPDETVLAIAFSCGFNSKAVFNSTFLNKVGLPPSQYRKSNVS